MASGKKREVEEEEEVLLSAKKEDMLKCDEEAPISKRHEELPRGSGSLHHHLTGNGTS